MTTQRETPPRLYETASGTTSPSNGDSGSSAYIIAGVALAILLGIGSSIGGCINQVSNIVADSYGVTTDDSYGDSYDNLEWLEEYFDETAPEQDFGWPMDEGLDGQDLSSDIDLKGSVTPEEALGSPLALYTYTIDANLSASDYANASQDVTTYVRTLVVSDKAAVAELTALLRPVARGAGDVDEALTKADELCGATIEVLNDLDLPKVGGENAKSVSRNLETGKGKAVARWEAIQAELHEFAKADSIMGSEVKDLEADVTEATDAAAECFSVALTESANR